jgi:pimeloyl-ACP methyl ester carboxylesterase
MAGGRCGHVRSPRLSPRGARLRCWRAVAPSEQTRTIEIAGRRFAWRSVGRGPLLLLLNGYAATGADWDPAFLSALAESFDVICPDNRGMGDSELGDSEQLTIDAMAGDLEALLDALGIERLPLVGWSMGGFVAQALAERSPQRVEAMVLLASAPAGPEAVPGQAASWALLTDHSGTPREQAGRLIAVLFPPALAPQIDRQAGALVADARAKLSARALSAQERALLAWRGEPRAAPGANAPPMLALCGGEDVVIPPENSELLAARWPGGRAERLTGGGHAFMAQEPIRVASLIEAFLRA